MRLITRAVVTAASAGLIAAPILTTQAHADTGLTSLSSNPVATQNCGCTEKPAPSENTAPSENAAPSEKPAPSENAAPSEKPSPTETTAPSEKPAPSENAAPSEKPSPTETTAPSEKPAENNVRSAVLDSTNITDTKVEPSGHWRSMSAHLSGTHASEGKLNDAVITVQNTGTQVEKHVVIEFGNGITTSTDKASSIDLSIPAGLQPGTEASYKLGDLDINGQPLAFKIHLDQN